MPPPQELLGPHVENSVRAQGGGGAVVEVEEPDSAVDDGEPHRQQGVHGADRQAVKSELEGLFRGLAYFPRDVGRDDGDQKGCQNPAPVSKSVKQTDRPYRLRLTRTAVLERPVGRLTPNLWGGEASLKSLLMP